MSTNPVGFGISFPFRIESGALKVSVSPDASLVTPAQVEEVVQGYLDQLFMTRVLEIPHMPTFGNPSHELLFGPAGQELADAVVFGIKQAIAEHLPNLVWLGHAFSTDNSGKVFFHPRIGLVGLPDPMTLRLALPQPIETR